VFILANPSVMKQCEGIKHTDDQHDAFFLAQMLILGILPQGYIYPKKDRPVRDLAPQNHRRPFSLTLNSKSPKRRLPKKALLIIDG
jgi:hypothetical protein